MAIRKPKANNLHKLTLQALRECTASLAYAVLIRIAEMNDMLLLLTVDISFRISPAAKEDK